MKRLGTDIGTLSIPKMKTCTQCKEAKPIYLYWPNKGGRDGYMAHCKTCHTKYVKAWQHQNPGHAKKRRIIRRGINPKKAMLQSVKQRAKRDGLCFYITEKDFEIPTHCPLLGIPLFYGNAAGPSENSPSMDRKDSTKGYIPGNVWVISHRANAMKRSGTVEELEMLAKNLRILIG